MKLKLIAFGIAKDIIGNSSMEIEVNEGMSVQGLKNHLVTEFPKFGPLASLRFAVNEEYQLDEYLLTENEEVVIIPPVSGG